MTAKEIMEALELGAEQMVQKIDSMQRDFIKESIIQLPISAGVVYIITQDGNTDTTLGILIDLVKNSRPNVRIEKTYCTDTTCRHTCYKTSDLMRFLVGSPICKRFVKICVNKKT